MITDFSGIIWDYTFLCDKPVMYANADIDLMPYDAYNMDHEIWQFETVRKIGIKIEETDNVGTIHDKLSILGRDLLKETLPNIFSGNITRTKQDESKVTFAYNIKREEEKIDFNKTKEEVFNQIRGMYPFPVAYTTLNNEIIKICSSRIGTNKKGTPGEIINVYKDGFGVSCSDGEIIITRIKPSGKKEMNASDFINGRRKENLLGEKLC